jgi:hypothetical protein
MQELRQMKPATRDEFLKVFNELRKTVRVREKTTRMREVERIVLFQ